MEEKVPKDKRLDDALKALVDALSDFPTSPRGAGKPEEGLPESAGPAEVAEGLAPAPPKAPAPRRPARKAPEPEIDADEAARRVLEYAGKRAPKEAPIKGKVQEEAPPRRGGLGLSGAVAAALILAALAYFAFFYSPSAWEGCWFGDELACGNYSVDRQTGDLSFEAAQSKADLIEVYSMTCGEDGEGRQDLANPVQMARGVPANVTGFGTGNRVACPGSGDAAYERAVCLHYTTMAGERIEGGDICGTIRGFYPEPTPTPLPSPCAVDCGDGTPCHDATQCQSRYCVPSSGTCGQCTGNCGTGLSCSNDAMCASGICRNGRCACASGCGVGSPCLNSAMCASGRCNNGVCIPGVERSVRECTTFYDSGAYLLDANIITPGTCFIVHADNVAFNCAGHKITGSNKGSAFLVEGSNVTLENCVVEWFEKGVATGTENGGVSLVNITFYRNTDSAVEIAAGDSSVSGCRFSGNGNGISLLPGSGGTTVTGNAFDGNTLNAVRAELGASGETLFVTDNSVRGSNGAGIALRNVTGGTVSGNDVSGNHGDGITLLGSSSGNAVEGNRAERNGGTGMLVSGSGNSISQNTVEMNGGDGIASSVGQNLADGNTACGNRGIDLTCPLGGVLEDRGGNTCDVVMCGVGCTPCPAVAACMTLNAPGNYSLSSDLSLSGDCVRITSDGVTLDCNGKTITGAGTGKGISVLNSKGFTLIGCNVSGFYDGYYFLNSEGNVYNSSSTNNSEDGMLVENCMDWNAVGCTAAGNMRHGVNFAGTGYGTMRSSDVSLNGADGVHSEYGFRLLENNTIAMNSGRGIYLGQSTGRLADNYACLNLAPYQLYCESAAAGMDGKGNACAPVHVCDVDCREC
ncbi:MAG: right-handed parallel beta-helix repeat-containing protein [Candidatus ainarchaeum sp.]|nr:right-handed parallel beta-helix repeat-containing protein [Candidatus ainarchaeum sp.]